MPLRDEEPVAIGGIGRRRVAVQDPTIKRSVGVQSAIGGVEMFFVPDEARDQRLQMVRAGAGR